MRLIAHPIHAFVPLLLAAALATGTACSSSSATGTGGGGSGAGGTGGTAGGATGSSSSGDPCAKTGSTCNNGITQGWFVTCTCTCGDQQIAGLESYLPGACCADCSALMGQACSAGDAGSDAGDAGSGDVYTSCVLTESHPNM